MPSKIYQAGDIVTYQGREVLYQEMLTFPEVVLLDPETRRKFTANAEDILPIISKKLGGDTLASTKRAEPHVNNYDAEQLKDARGKLLAVDGIRSAKRAKGDYVEIAEKAGVSTRTIYNWKDRFEEDGKVTALIDRKRGPKPGLKRLPIEVEEQFAKAFSEVLKTGAALTFRKFSRALRKAVRAIGGKPPHLNTVRSRFREILGKRARRDQALDPDQSHINPGGSNTTVHCLQVNQCDHTLLNIMVVDPVTRLVIGRPWITVMIDTHTRMIVGIYLSMDPPSAISVTMCMFNAVEPKTAYLRSLGLEDVEWSAFGISEEYHWDNAREFDSLAVERVILLLAATPEFRPVATPHWGGHIERFMLEHSNMLLDFPGATGNSPKQRKELGLDPEKDAIFTLQELEKVLVKWICGVYHKHINRETERSPAFMWQADIEKTGMPRRYEDPEKLSKFCLPARLLAVRKYGLRWKNITYFDDALRPYIDAKMPGRVRAARKYWVHRDPRDISVVHLYDDENGGFYTIPYRNRSHPAISEWELRAAIKKAKMDGISVPDEDAIFKAYDEIDADAEQSRRETKKARRHFAHQQQREKMKQTAPTPATDASASSSASAVQKEVQETTTAKRPRALPFED